MECPPRPTPCAAVLTGWLESEFRDTKRSVTTAHRSAEQGKSEPEGRVATSFRSQQSYLPRWGAFSLVGCQNDPFRRGLVRKKYQAEHSCAFV